MAKRKPVDISNLRRDDAQVDGFAGRSANQRQHNLGGQRARRVESLPLSVIIPDRFQPRPLLPSWIRVGFFRGEISVLFFSSDDQQIKRNYKKNT